MKYKLTAETKMWCDHELHRIEATKDFGDVKAGDLGGWIENEENLSQEGDAWVYGNAWVSDNARVTGNARVTDNARVCDNARVYGNARVSGDAWVCGDARVTFSYKENFGLSSTAGAVFKNSWSSHRDFFYNFKTRLWSVGCFLGTSEELCRKAYADSEESGDRYGEYIKFVEMFRGGDHVDTEAIKKEVLEDEASEDA